ncbi:MAG TPA: GAF domain-containing protein [Methylomirabilota bacterium]|jgi:PAS domain S-box-containing protein|nr:GAF domain-containing protein [Methylomirabilota bacterium]
MAVSALALDRGFIPRLARAMTASLELGDVLAEAAQAAGQLLPDSLVLMWMLEGDRLALRGVAGVLECAHSGLRLDLGVGKGLAGHVARGRQPLMVRDPAHDPRTEQGDFLSAERVRWFIGLPISGRYALEGVLGVLNRSDEAPEPETIEALGALAAQVALAVEGARLDEHGERRRREAEALAAVGQALAHTLDPGEVAQLIADSVTALLGARGATVYRLDRQTGDMVPVAYHGRSEPGNHVSLPPGVGLAGKAALERRPQITRDALNDPTLTLTPELRARLQHLDLRSAMSVPLLVNGEVIGGLSVGASADRIFDDEARRLLETFADQASVALNNARLFTAERIARADAQAAERRFRGLVESIDAVVAEFDPQTRRVLFVSGRAETLLGHPLEAWTNKPDFWIEHVHPDDRQRVTEFSRAEASAGRDHVQEYRMLTLDGRVVWVRDSARIVHDAGVARLRCLQVDVTERKRTEALLAGERRVLEMIAAGETLPHVLEAVCRMVETQGEGMLSSVLLVEGDRLRVGAAPGLPREWVEAVEGTMIGPETSAVGSAAFRREPIVVDDVADDPRWARDRALALRHSLRSCLAVPVLEAGGVVLAVFVAHDRRPRQPGETDRRLIERAARLAGIAIERVRAEDALRESEHRYRTLLTNIPDVAWLLDRDGNTVFVSPNVDSVGGYTADEVCRAGAQGWLARVHPDDQPMVRQHYGRLFDGGPATFDVEYRLRHRDGRWLWLHDRAVAIYEGHGTTYIYGLYSNITDRKQNEEIRALLLNQVITVQEEERRRIARELHDETAQSLASLRMGLSTLQEARTIRAARAQARDLLQIATRALAEVRRLAWGLRPSVLDDLGLATAVARYAEEFRRTRSIAVEVETVGLEPERLPPVVETALYRILQEALSNVARHAGAHHVKVRLERGESAVTLTIEDDGAGFDPTRPPAPATAARGLGIHTMRERAAVHKGELTIDSMPGRGTQVAVAIPLPERRP